SRSIVVSTVSTTGTVQASQQVNLTFDIGTTGTGKIKEFLVGLGDQVTQRQALARLDDTVLQQAVRSAQVALDSAQARYDASVNPSAADIAAAQQTVSSATAQVTTAQNNLNTLLAAPTAADVLSAQQVVSTAEAGVTKAQSDLAALQSNVTGAQNDVSTAKASLDNEYQALVSTLTSPAWPASSAKPSVSE